MGCVKLGRFVIVMTRTQPNPLLKKKFITQPNPTHQPIKPEPTQWVGLDQVGFGGLMGWLHTLSCHIPCMQ